MYRPMIAALVAGSCVALGSAAARADGAFPDSQGLMLPADKPNQIMLATTFGVVMTLDGGQTWTYSCEMMTNGNLAAFYNIGPAPKDRLFAITDMALIYTDDLACTWGKSGGMLAGKPPVDYFPDPSNANRVWAALAPAVTTDPYTIVESLDGGATFSTVRFTAAAGDTITGVEISKSDANTAYVTLRGASNFAPKLAMTKDGGTTWTTHDLSTVAGIGNANIRLVAIDPTTPDQDLPARADPVGRDEGRRDRALARRRRDLRVAAADRPDRRRAQRVHAPQQRDVARGRHRRRPQRHLPVDQRRHDLHRARRAAGARARPA